MHFQLGWRNIWRNPRRTTVILMAVVVGVWSMILMGALMRGIGDQMVQNSISTLTGHIQVHQRGYRDDPAIENSLSEPEELEAALQRLLPSEAHWTSRVRVSAVVSNARHSKGINLLGIDPVREARVSFIGDAVTQGRYLDPGENHGILIGEALREKFDTDLGRKLVLMSQDTGGEIASRAFRIIGIFRAELEATEKQYVFVTLSAAQKMLKLGEGVSEVAILLSSHKGVEPIAENLRNGLTFGDYEVHPWTEILSFLTAILSLYDWSIFLWFLVIFIAMGFGIVNTMLMAVFERFREFGLLKALGMKPGWIVLAVLIESSFLLIIGLGLGNGLGILSHYLLKGSGIDLSSLAAGMEYAGMSRVIYPNLHFKDVVMANLVVFVLGLFVSLYPALKAARISPVEAMVHA
jgi:ABC-type lipoprotein release transport system permease subunit